MSKAPASFFQDTTTNGPKSWHFLFIPHDVVKAATVMAEYVTEFTIKPDQSEG